jgi:hypothetical protein
VTYVSSLAGRHSAQGSGTQASRPSSHHHGPSWRGVQREWPGTQPLGYAPKYGVRPSLRCVPQTANTRAPSLVTPCHLCRTTGPNDLSPYTPAGGVGMWMPHSVGWAHPLSNFGPMLGHRNQAAALSRYCVPLDLLAMYSMMFYQPFACFWQASHWSSRLSYGFPRGVVILALL